MIGVTSPSFSMRIMLVLLVLLLFLGASCPACFFLFLCWLLFGFGCVIVMLRTHGRGTCNLFDIFRHLFGKDHLTFELRVAKGQKNSL